MNKPLDLHLNQRHDNNDHQEQSASVALYLIAVPLFILASLLILNGLFSESLSSMAIGVIGLAARWDSSARTPPGSLANLDYACSAKHRHRLATDRNQLAGRAPQGCRRVTIAVAGMLDDRAIAAPLQRIERGLWLNEFDGPGQ